MNFVLLYPKSSPSLGLLVMFVLAKNELLGYFERRLLGGHKKQYNPKKKYFETLQKILRNRYFIAQGISYYNVCLGHYVKSKKEVPEHVGQFGIIHTCG